MQGLFLYIFKLMKNRHSIFFIIVLGVFALLTWQFSNIVLYFIIASIVATFLNPLVKYLSERKFFGIRIPRIFSVIIAYFTLLLLIGAFITLFIPLIAAQIDVLSGLDFNAVADKFQAPVHSVEDFLRNMNFTQKEGSFLLEDTRNDILNLVQKMDFSELANNLIALTGGLFVGFLAVTFISFFLLYDSGILKRNLINFVPNAYFELTIGTITKIEMLLGNYLVGLLIQMISIFTLASIGLSIIGVKFSLTIAVFAALANLIPYLGPIIGAAFGILIGISTSVNILDTPNDFLVLSLSIAIVFAIVQVIDNLFLQPLIFSRSVKAHPLEIFVVIFAGASLAGIPGMIAAIPAYTIIRVSAKEFYNGYKGYRIFRTA